MSVRHNQTPDIQGRKFGKLRVVSFSGYRGTPTRHAHWKCQCDCGEFRVVRGTSLKAGLFGACVKCSMAAGRIKHSLNRRLPDGGAARNRVFEWYLTNARRRCLIFDLSFEQCCILFRSACAYCGSLPSAVAKVRSAGEDFTYNGIDRRDNSKGYTVENVLPCCCICNRAKKDMSELDFRSWIDRIRGLKT